MHVPVQRQEEPAETEAQGAELDSLLNWQKQPVSLDRIERRPRRRAWPIVLTTLLALFLATLAGFYVFTRAKGKFSEQDVKLTMETAATTASGSEVTLTVSYQNGQSVDLRSAELTLTYPEGFSVTSAEPSTAAELKNTWALGTISAGYAGQVTIRGVLVGTLDSRKEFFATVAYRPQNFNSDFSVKAQVGVEITSSLLSIEFPGPTNAVPGAATAVAVAVKNTSPTELKNLKLIADPAEDFTFQKAAPAPDESESQAWTLPVIAPGADTTVTVTGAFKGNPGETRELSFRVGVIEAGTFTLQNTAVATVTLVNPQFSLAVTLNGKTDGSVALGDQLTYEATYRNTSDLVLTDVVITAQFSGTAFDWTKVETTPPANSTDAAKGKIVWTKSELVALADLEPGVEGTLKISVPLVAILPGGKMTEKDVTLSSAWKAVTGKIDSLGGPLEANSETLVTKIRTTAKLKAEGRYYAEEGNALGSGPLPPVVGKTTSYRINWIIDNSVNDVTNATVKAVLPETAFWTGKVTTATTGTLFFYPATRTVIWTLSRIPSGTGTATAELSAEFELSVTPTASDVGLLMVLSERTVLSGTDAFTGETVEVERPRLTTDLELDVQARGKGIVAATSAN